MGTPITEEMKVHEEWYEAKPSLAELPEFLRHLTEDYEHDYGTICHAITAGALATMRAIDRSPQGGITGFQASCIMWEVIKRWMHYEGPLRLLQYENALYPQYDHKFNSITKSIWEWLQKEAKKNLGNGRQVHPNVLAHWKSIAEGNIPFGLKLSDD